MLKQKLENMTTASKLGYLQHLAGQIYLKESLSEDIREDALTMEEVGVKHYENMFLGKCSLKALVEFDPEKAEKEVDELIIKYCDLLGEKNA